MSHPYRRAIAALLVIASLSLRAQFGAQHIVFTGENTVRNVVVADLDGDFDNDLVMGDADGCYRFLNADGAGTFGAPDTIVMIPTSISHGVYGVVDMDGDVDVDLVLHDTDERELLLFSNDGTGTFGPAQLIATTDTYGFIQEVQCADITGSDLPEVLILYGGTLRWFINVDGTFPATDSLQHTATEECRNLLVGDIDMDGDPDHTVSAMDGTVHVGLNDADGTSWSSVPLTYNFGTLYYFGHTLIDVDADGDLDLVDGMNDVQWLENTVADSGTWGDYIEHHIADAWNEGAGWSEHMGCGTGASVFWCPWAYNTPLRWSHYDPASGEMTPPILLTGVPPVGDGRMYFGDLNGDERKDLIAFQHDTLSWFSNELGGFASTPPLDLLCSGDAPYPLPDGLPAGGDWSGPFVTNDVFDAMLAPPGTYALSYSAIDSLGCPASVNVDLVVEICTGQRPMAEASHLLIAPNPADDHVSITFLEHGPADLEVLDAMGRTLLRRYHVSSPFHLEVEGIPSGLYRVRVSYRDGSTHTGSWMVR